MDRRKARAATTAALTVILAGCGLLDPDPWADREAALDRNRALWEAAGIDSYQYRLNRLCFCALFGEFRITVAGGTVTAAERLGLEGGPIAAADLQYLQSVDDLFDRAEQAVENRAYRFHAEYHPELGYLTLLDLDPVRNAIDEEVRFEASDLAPAVDALAGADPGGAPRAGR